MKTTKVILGMAAAAAAGVAIGMLIAPEKGEELQKKLSDGARTWLAEIASVLGTVKNAAVEKKNEAERKLVEELNGSNERI